VFLLVLGCSGSGPLGGDGVAGLGQGAWTEQFEVAIGSYELAGDQDLVGFDFVFEGPDELLENIDTVELELGVHGIVTGSKSSELVLYLLPESYDGGFLGADVEVVDRAVIIGEQGFQHGLKSPGELETHLALKLDGETSVELDATGWAWIGGEDRPDGDLVLEVLEAP
jgi:hypothetical protein